MRTDAGSAPQSSGIGQAVSTTGQGVEQHGSGQGKTEDLGRSQKRSLTNLRKRDRSTASKRSNRRQNEMNEKGTVPSSTDQSAEARPKKKGGFLSFLNCCGAPDESQEVGQADTAQPAKPPKSQPMRAQQPTQTRQQQDVSAAGTSADSKEIIDEKASQPPYQDVLTAEPVMASAQQRSQVGDATVDKPVPNLPNDAPPLHTNAEVRPLQENRQGLVPEEPITGPPHVDTGATPREDPSSSQSPQLQVQAPTPVVKQQEDEMILDRTPEQAQRDNDIEMSDAGPSLPLTEHDAAAVQEEEKQAHERRESVGVRQEDLPGPPPIVSKQDTASNDVPAVSHETSLVSTPEPAPKWLLPPIKPEMRGRKCLVLDLDETLVHSSFKVSSVRSRGWNWYANLDFADSPPSRFYDTRRD